MFTASAVTFRGAEGSTDTVQGEREGRERGGEGRGGEGRGGEEGRQERRLEGVCGSCSPL